MDSSGKGLRELVELERVFKALSHESRRHVLIVLNARGGRMTAGEIARRFHCSWPTTSRHLKILVNAGLISVEKRGRELMYILETATLRSVVGNWLGWFDTDGSQVRMIVEEETN